jgi:hypothetical protein
VGQWGLLEIVDGGSGAVHAAGGDGPADDAWFRLLDFPARSLLAPVMTSAFRGQIALTGRSVWISDSMVEVAEDSLGTAGGSSAGGGPSTNEVLESSAGGVAVLGVRVVTPSLGDGTEGDVQAADQVG